ncbi:MAG: hypothetical protein LBH45_03290 [Campylobacteraceae bacterium]|jgi:hypothetical protein|nr:hypothetical protein [Campylobacteraceae bacterium]
MEVRVIRGIVRENESQNIGSIGSFQGRVNSGGRYRGTMLSVAIRSDHILIDSTYVMFTNVTKLYSTGDELLAVGLEDKKSGGIRGFYYYNLTKQTYQRPAGAFSGFLGGFFIALTLFLCGLGFIEVFIFGGKWTDGDGVMFVISLIFLIASLSWYFNWRRMGEIKKVFLSELNKLNIRL